MTQGYPLSPTIFNVDIDSVLQPWVMVVVKGEDRPDGFGWAVRNMVALFYADDILLG